jgi:hypothetical protein
MNVSDNNPTVYPLYLSKKISLGLKLPMQSNFAVPITTPILSNNDLSLYELRKPSIFVVE